MGYRIVDLLRDENLRSEISRYGGGFGALAPLIFDVDAAFHGLRPFLEFRGDLTHIPEVGKGFRSLVTTPIDRLMMRNCSLLPWRSMESMESGISLTRLPVTPHASQ